MSRKAARNAVATWLAPPNVAGLNTVYTGEPRLVRDEDYIAGVQPPVLSGAVGFPFVERQHEQRIAVGGATGGMKMITYELAFAVRFKSAQKKGEDADDDHDSVIDAVVARIRSDRTLGGAFWQAGEGDTRFGQDIDVVSGTPKQRTKDGPIIIWSVVRFKAIEMVST
jgi:hypothetical protein